MNDNHVHLSFFRMSFHILMPGLTWASSAVSIISGFWILFLDSIADALFQLESGIR